MNTQQYQALLARIAELEARLAALEAKKTLTLKKPNAQAE